MNARVQVSLNAPMAEALDQAARQLNMSRADFLRSSVDAKLKLMQAAVDGKALGLRNLSLLLSTFGPRMFGGLLGQQRLAEQVCGGRLFSRLQVFAKENSMPEDDALIWALFMQLRRAGTRVRAGWVMARLRELGRAIKRQKGGAR